MERGPEHLPQQSLPLHPEVYVLGTLRVKLYEAKALVEAFSESEFTLDHLSFFTSFELSLKALYEDLHLLDTLPKAKRLQQASYLLRGLREHLGPIQSFVQGGLLTFEETILSRALYSQIETRLRILAGSEYHQNWEGPNITGDNRPVIEGGQS